MNKGALTVAIADRVVFTRKRGFARADEAHQDGPARDALWYSTRALRSPWTSSRYWYHRKRIAHAMRQERTTRSAAAAIHKLLEC